MIVIIMIVIIIIVIIIIVIIIIVIIIIVIIIIVIIIIVIIIIIIINFRNLNCHIWKYFIPFLLEPNKLHFTFVKQRQNRMTFSIHCEKSISKN